MITQKTIELCIYLFKIFSKIVKNCYTLLATTAASLLQTILIVIAITIFIDYFAFFIITPEIYYITSTKPELKLPHYKEFMRTVSPNNNWQNMDIKIAKGDFVKITSTGLVSPSVRPLEEFYSKFAKEHYIILKRSKIFRLEFFDSFLPGSKKIRPDVNDPKQKENESNIINEENHFWEWIWIYKLFYNQDGMKSLDNNTLTKMIKNIDENNEYDEIKESGKYKYIYKILTCITDCNDDERKSYLKTIKIYLRHDRLDDGSNFLKWINDIDKKLKKFPREIWRHTSSSGYKLEEYDELKQYNIIPQYYNVCTDKSMAIRGLPHNVLVMAASKNTTEDLAANLNTFEIIYQDQTISDRTFDRIKYSNDFNGSFSKEFRIGYNDQSDSTKFKQLSSNVYEFALIPGEKEIEFTAGSDYSLAFCINDSKDFRWDNGGFFIIKIRILSPYKINSFDKITSYFK